MDLLPSQEQLELSGLAAEFFAEQLPISRIRERRAEPAAITRASWAAAAELGLLGVSAAEDIGGLGLGLDDEVLLFREELIGGRDHRSAQRPRGHVRKVEWILREIRRQAHSRRGVAIARNAGRPG